MQPRRSALAMLRARSVAIGVGGVAITLALAVSFWGERSVHAATPAPISSALSSEVEKEIIRTGELGLVVAEIAFALGPDAKDSGACPSGMSGGLRALMDAYKKTPAGMLKEGETPQVYERRLEVSVSTAPDGQNLCLHPEAGSPDSNWRMVAGRNLRVGGIDLDGQHSGSKRTAGPGCGHEDFVGTNGERGVDNQFYRVVGCTTGYQSTGLANSFQIEMHTGSWGIVLALKGIDNVRNDPDVQVGIYANADPIQLSADRKPLAFATYAVHQDPRYRASARGRIVDGVLTIDPVDVRFPNVVNSMWDDRVLRDARLRLTFTAEGGMEGYLGGYTPVEDMYNLQFGARVSKTAKGELAPERQRVNTSVGRSGALGSTCNGAYYALRQAADGHRDPKTGLCTSISTQYRIRLLPAFVVDARTQSINSPLTLQ